METSIKNQNKRITVLDRGFVQYVSHMGDDLTVVNAARVSFNKQSDWELDQEAKQRLDETNSFYWEEDLYRISERDKKLIKYLAEHNHWTPFAHPQITLRIRAPISIRTQFFKHKQDFILNEDTLAICDSFYKTVASESLKVYNRLIESGVAPEQARFVLPQGTYTEWWWTGSLAAYARVCKQRSDPHAQWEIREYASAIKEMIAPLFPVSWDYLT
jgi:thymidylate synthase (FAD)